MFHVEQFGINLLISGLLVVSTGAIWTTNSDIWV